VQALGKSLDNADVITFGVLLVKTEEQTLNLQMLSEIVLVLISLIETISSL